MARYLIVVWYGPVKKKRKEKKRDNYEKIQSRGSRRRFLMFISSQSASILFDGNKLAVECRIVARVITERIRVSRKMTFLSKTSESVRSRTSAWTFIFLLPLSKCHNIRLMVRRWFSRWHWDKNGITDNFRRCQWNSTERRSIVKLYCRLRDCAGAHRGII